MSRGRTAATAVNFGLGGAVPEGVWKPKQVEIIEGSAV